MSGIVLIIVSLLISGGSAFLLAMIVKKNQSRMLERLESIKGTLTSKKEEREHVERIYSDMIDLGTMRSLAVEVKAAEDALRAEKGRITITQAELETVEGRLRELEEIERELEASGIETKEELNILQKKQEDLRSKNDDLKSRLSELKLQINEFLNTLEQNSAAAQQVMKMQSELAQAEEKIATLLVQIELGNEQYFILKRRYDALDIEYAQLYEKFSESAANEKK